MTSYRYQATNALTGEMLADWIPLKVDSFARHLSATGDMTATLDLHADPRYNAHYLEALEPRRTLLWVYDDLLPVWAGIVWDWPHASAASNQLPIRATTAESMLLHRELRLDQSIGTTDVAEIITRLIHYGTTGYGAQLPWLMTPIIPAGKRTSLDIVNTDSKYILDAINVLASGADFEILWEPRLLGGITPVVQPLIGVPYVGTPPGATNIVLNMPGNCVDYSWPRIGSNSANDVRATATSNAADGTQTQWISGSGFGLDLDDIVAGYPIMQTTVGFPGGIVSVQQMVDTYATNQQTKRRGTATTPTARIGPGLYPQLRDIPIGAYTRLAVTSSLHPQDPGTLGPGLERTARIVGWTCHPASDQQDEYIDLELGELDPSI